jgi:hypothetical protein
VVIYATMIASEAASMLAMEGLKLLIVLEVNAARILAAERDP